jgi:hypothetical protein
VISWFTGGKHYHLHSAALFLIMVTLQNSTPISEDSSRYIQLFKTLRKNIYIIFHRHIQCPQHGQDLPRLSPITLFVHKWREGGRERMIEWIILIGSGQALSIGNMIHNHSFFFEIRYIIIHSFYNPVRYMNHVDCKEKR